MKDLDISILEHSLKEALEENHELRVTLMKTRCRFVPMNEMTDPDYEEMRREIEFLREEHSRAMLTIEKQKEFYDGLIPLLARKDNL